MNSIRSELNSLLVSEFRSRKSSSAGLFSIVAALFSWSMAIYLSEALCLHHPNYEILIKFSALVFIGTRWRALGNMMHECAHGIFVHKAEHNTLFGHFISALDFSSFPEYLAQHVSHHAYLGNPDRDLDFKSRRVFLASSMNKPLHLIRLVFCCLTLVPLWFSMLRPVFWTKSIPLWTNLVRALLLMGLLSTLLFSATREIAFFYFLLPYLTSYHWLKLISDASDHLFLYHKQEILERSRNHILPTRFLNWFIFPRNDSYHLLHHLFPSLPTHHYPRVHKLFLNHPWYARQEHGWAEKKIPSELVATQIQGHRR